MTWQVILAVVAAVVGTIYVTAFWDDIRETVSQWLRDCGWEKSLLMDAWIKLDLLVGNIRCRVFLQKKQTEEVKTFETTYTLDEIDDPDVLAELQKRGYVERNIMEYIQ